ncbi:MAG: ABC transporter permease [Treponema sp.]|nr:ABC transporter permease [Treponema sp.]
MEKAITVKTLAFANIKKKPYRTAALTILVALAAGALFGTLFLAASIKGGLGGIKTRIGADLMIVPQGYESQAESVLLSGEPNYFYMSKEIEKKVQKIKGVGAVTSQFYLTSLSESCCDFPIQIIGFEPSTDFIVKSWSKKIVKAYDSQNQKEIIFSGSNISNEKNSIKFFGTTHNVTACLAKSGTGMDNVVYVDLATLQKMFEDAVSKGFGFISDGDTKSKTSVIFVKLQEGAKPDSTAARIKGAIPGVQVIQSGKFISGILKSVSSFLIFLYAVSIIVILITVLTLSVVFALTINERLREFSILRVLGADFKKLRAIVFFEAAFLGSLGAFSGIALSALILLPFNFVISQKISMPFIMPGAVHIIFFAIITFVILVAACLFSAIFGAVKVSKHEVYEGIK